MEGKSRKNGYNLPLDKFQVSSWVMFSFFLIAFYAFYAPLLDGGLSQVFQIIYSLVALVVIGTDVAGTTFNPADPAVLAAELGIPELPTNGDADGKLFCCICNVKVKPTSKHCRVCNKCVDQFDHHCKWLNNCVGSRTYRLFFALMTSALVFLVLQIVIGVYLIVMYTSRRDVFDTRVSTASITTPVGHFASIVVATSLQIPALLFLGQLYLFHCQLLYQGLSTYEYLVAQKQKKLARQRQDDADNANGSEKPDGKAKTRFAFSFSKSNKVTHARNSPKKVQPADSSSEKSPADKDVVVRGTAAEPNMVDSSSCTDVGDAADCRSGDDGDVVSGTIPMADDSFAEQKLAVPEEVASHIPALLTADVGDHVDWDSQASRANQAARKVAKAKSKEEELPPLKDPKAKAKERASLTHDTST